MSTLSENTRDRARANYKTTRTPSHRLPLLFFVSFVFIFVSSSATTVAASSSYESRLLEKWKGTKEYAKAEKQAKALVERVQSSLKEGGGKEKMTTISKQRETKAAIATHSNMCVARRYIDLCEGKTNEGECNAEPACWWDVAQTTPKCTNPVAEPTEMGIELGASLMLLVPVLTCGFGGLEGEAACTTLAADGWGCVWTAADSSCGVDMTESALTNVFGDSFLAKLIVQGSQCGEITSEVACVDACAWDATFSSCGSRTDLKTSLYSSYCDTDTKTQVDTTDYSEVLCAEKTCSTLTSDSACSASSVCMYDGTSCSASIDILFKSLAVTFGGKLATHIDVMTCAKGLTNCAELSNCEVLSSNGEPICVPTDAAYDAALPNNALLADMEKNDYTCSMHDSSSSCATDSKCVWSFDDSDCNANPNSIEVTCGSGVSLDSAAGALRRDGLRLAATTAFVLLPLLLLLP
ncbi:unnamed protein product [Bathycoccus prasinos]